MEGKHSTHFINVDLDVQGDSSLSELTEALSGIAFNLNEGLADCEGFARYEVLSEVGEPQQVIECFVDVLENLSGNARRLWDKASYREFSLGIQGGLEPHASEWRIDPTLLARVAALKAQLSFVVYAPDFDDEH